ncbi:methionine biosynthesis protein MetW [bacterium]|nr:methionine biosynthesis protein MetW [bacterium]
MKYNVKKTKGLKPNYDIVSKMVKENSSVLDLGCGEGELLKELVDNKNVKGLGIEINQDYVVKALEKGLQIIQDNIDEGLKDFENGQWDYVILNQTLQSTVKPDFVVEEMLRIGKKVILSFPNFAYWKVRFDLFFNGKMPKSDFLPFEWYNTPNIHLLTINDFFEFCKKRQIKIEKAIYCTRGKIKNSIFKATANLLSEEAIFLITR